MRVSSLRSFLPLITLSLGTCQYVHAQDALPSCTPGLGAFSSYGPTVRSTVPFTAIVKTTFEQKLGDGNIIHGEAHTREARSSTGKTLNEQALRCELDADGKAVLLKMVNVYDPANDVRMMWQVGTDRPKTVSVTHPSNYKPAPLTPEQIAEQQKLSRAQVRRIHQRESKSEDLGVRTIAGVTAHGYRTTQIIPAGEEGNQQPLEIVRERWESKDLGQIVLGIQDDPRRGRTTVEYEELTQGEPNPAVFQPPPGWTYEEQRPQAPMVVPKPE